MSYTLCAVSQNRKSHSAKVITHLEGDDEFSITSVDPVRRKPTVEIKVDDTALPGRPKSTTNERTLWRMFRKLF